MKIDQKIPEGWSVKKLGNIVNTFSGGTPLAGEASYYKNGAIPFIRSGEIYQNYTELFITEKGLRESSAKMVKKGDLLFALYGANSGEVAISRIDGAINQAILCIRPKYDNIDYLNNAFILSKNKILHKYLQGGQGNLSAEIVKSLSFIFPPLAEQKKIAEILSCWDEGIEKLSALIEKKKLQKKALMQKLLTAKIRLPGFTDPWKNVKLGDVCKISTGESNREDSSLDGKYTFFDRSQEVRTSNRYLFDGEAIIVAGEGQDFVPKYFFGKFDLHQRSYCLMNFENIFGKFLFFLLSLNKNYFLQQAVGSTVKSLRLPMFLKMKLYLPSSLAEQKAIADILSKADEEIELLNKKLEAFKLEKKALMQKLLTGKIRVKVN